MRYCVDIDGTICTLTPDPKTYEDAKPWNDRIETINKLYDEGNHITYFTARGMGRFSDDPNASAKASALLFDLTEKQLKDWGCKYHDLILGKPHADFFIDDKGIQCDDFFNDK